MKNRQIEHRGVVDSVTPISVNVSIVQETACGACAAAQLCHSAEKQQKRIEIHCTDAEQYTIGQDVVVVGTLGLGLAAIFWAYVLPLFLLLAMLAVFVQFVSNEGLCAIAALFSLIPYYIGLYLLRGKLQRLFAFRIKNNNP